LDDSGDGRFFNLDSSTLTISGTTTSSEFDFENPQDGNSDNIYSFDITLSDGTDSVRKTLDITINDVEGPLTCSSGEIVELPENQSGPIYTFVADKPDRHPTEIDFNVPMNITRSGVDQNRGSFAGSMSLMNFDRLRAEIDVGTFGFVNAEQEGNLDETYKIELEVLHQSESATCSVEVQIVDVENEVLSGIKFSGAFPKNSALVLADIGDIDQDGLSDVWIMTYESMDRSPPIHKGHLVFGHAMRDALSGDGKEEFLVDRFNPTQAVEVFGVFDSVRPDNEFDGNSLVANPIGDIDGDGLPEVLLTLNTPTTSLANAFDDRPLAYILWGAALTSQGDGQIDLNNLAAHEGFIFEGLGGINRRDNTAVSGDFDGDGIDDVLIGIPQATIRASDTSRYRGTVFLVFGDHIQSIKAEGRIDLFEDISSLLAEEVMLLTSEDQDDTATESGLPLLSGSGRYMFALDDISGDGADELVLSGLNSEQHIMNLAVIDSAAIVAAKSGSGLLEYEDIPNTQINVIRTRENVIGGDRSGDFDGDGIHDLLFIKDDFFETTEFAALIPGSELQGNIAGLEIDVEGGVNNANVIHFDRPTDYSQVHAISFIGDIDGDGRDDLFLSYSYTANNISADEMTIILSSALDSFIGGGVFRLDQIQSGDGIYLTNAINGDTNILSASLNDIDGDNILDLALSAYPDGGKEAYVLLGSDLRAAIASGATTFDLGANFRAVDD
jgi:hypothetical protein